MTRSLTPQDMLCFALYSAGHAMQQAYKPLLDPLGLTYPQYLVLSALWAEDGRTLGALAIQMQLASNTLTPLVKRLEAKRLVTRQRDPQDERQLRIRLTDAGRALQDKSAEVARCFLDMTGLDMPEAVRLRDEVLALRDRLRDDPDDPDDPEGQAC
ncbi:MarR family winged helix-turn-helix transcriptional regulator [Maliponia aquimaris]|uniref:Organic hydroperoxide resistance transcriptional regulator n=1 Tax=Maliponia aquimaris TaxID=1673631 RepID=A0A238K6I2_9RHOB|nr:MarR family transcriptional regulator [Maliponia aquimaris]SMX38403.1 Organic hydroperoxide resistance transcriptional regulator [Maliponia aquimaris]